MDKVGVVRVCFGLACNGDPDQSDLYQALRTDEELTRYFNVRRSSGCCGGCRAKPRVNVQLEKETIRYGRATNIGPEDDYKGFDPEHPELLVEELVREYGN